MTDNKMYIPNNNTQNYSFCSVKLVVETFEHPTLKFTKVPKVDKVTNKKTLL